MTRAAGWVTLFVIGTGLFVVSPVLPQIAEDLAVSEAAAGWTVTVFALAYVVGGPWLGSNADRYGSRRVLVASLALFVAANVATALAADLPVLLACRAVAGFAAAGVTPSVYALVGAGAPPGRQATWLSAITSGLLVALVIGAPAGGLLASTIGWHGVFLCVGGIAAVALAIDLHRTRDTRPPLPRRARSGLPFGVKIRAVSTTAMWALAVYGLYTYLGVGLAGAARLAPGLVATALAAYGLGAVAGNLAGGVLADRYGGSRVAVASLVALAAMEVLVGLVIHRGPAVLVVVVLAAFSLAAYQYFTAHQVRLLAAFPADSGTLFAWNNTALYGGILVGSAVGGRVISVMGFSGLAWSVAAAALVAALVCPRIIPAPVQRAFSASHAPG